jgi:hypothetical protein
MSSSQRLCLGSALQSSSLTSLTSPKQQPRYSALIRGSACPYTYRYFFHALGRFPGPRRARLSSIWAVPDAVIKAQWHLRVNRLYSEYGDFVRISMCLAGGKPFSIPSSLRSQFYLLEPNEISINNPGTLKDIHDIYTKCTKGPFYDVNYPHKSLQMARKKAYHSKRRRLWDRAFTSRGLHLHCSNDKRS